VSQSSTLFRCMLDSDLDEIMRIELEAYPHPWTRGIFDDCLKSKYSCWVGECNGQVDSYAVMGLAAGECHLLNLCVRQDRQGQGQGAKMLKHVLSVVRSCNVDMMLLEVRASNRGAQQLYRSFGFDQIAERKGYYPDGNGREDAMIYALSLL